MWSIETECTPDSFADSRLPKQTPSEAKATLGNETIMQTTIILCTVAYKKDHSIPSKIPNISYL